MIDKNGTIIERVFMRTEYNFDRMENSNETATTGNPDDDMTQQQFKDECDINVIVANFGITGLAPQLTQMPTYGDYTNEITDYQTAQNVIAQANQAFGELPSKIRERFQNDPQKLMEYMAEEGHENELRDLGLLPPKAKAPEAAPGGQAPADKKDT